MKPWIKAFGMISCVLFLFATIGHAQTTNDSVVAWEANLAELPALSLTDVPRSGTFWVVMPPNGRNGGVTAPYPSLPPSFDSTNIFLLADGALLVDSTGGNDGNNTEQLAAQINAVSNVIARAENHAATQSQSLMRANGYSAMAYSDPPFPGGGNGGTNGLPSSNSYTLPDYGTNLWIAQWTLTNGYLTGIASNTIADVKYEFLTNSDLTTTNWGHTGVFIYGSEATNWTALVPLSVDPTTNLFFRLLSYVSSDGSGLADWWEQEYGLTDPYGDPAGDGWANIQKYQWGWNPNVFYTPPSPQVNITFNALNNLVTINWPPSPGPVTGYLITKFDVLTGTTTFNVSSNTFSFVDDLTAYAGITNIAPVNLYPYYDVQAQYAGGNSENNYYAPVNIASPAINLINGPQGKLYFAMRGLPSDLSKLRVYREQFGWNTTLMYDDYGSQDAYFSELAFAPSPMDDGYFDIPAEAITNGICAIPDTQTLPFFSNHFSVQTVSSNGLTSGWMEATASGNPASAFVDARRQLKDNLQFLLRGAGNYPITFQVFGAFASPGIQFPNNYVYAGFYSSGSLSPASYSFSWLRPIADNIFYRNFVLDPDNLAASGLLNTVYPSDNYYDFNPPGTAYFIFPISLTNLPPYYFDSEPFLSNALDNVSYSAPSSQLSLAESQWILPPYAGPIDFGRGANYGYPALDNNCYGLPVISEEIAYTTTNGVFTLTKCAPSSSMLSSGQGVVYSEVAQPILVLSNYYFARPGYDPMPESGNFSMPATNPCIIQGVGTSQQIVGYAQFSVLHASAGVCGYLGQYFDQAYKIDSNGNVTATATGVLSPSGSFFATEPGDAALVTKPDIDTDDRGVATVHCISLQVDKNHDGNMDLAWNGPDVTTPSSPFVFWCNDNFDRWDDDGVFGTPEQDDQQSGNCPFTPYVTTPDFNYLDDIGNREIPCTRDLEDYARLWVCGITSNLLQNLPANSTITLSWGDMDSPNPSNPTIDLFMAADADGGIGYLTNLDVGERQIVNEYNPYVGRLQPGGSLQLNAGKFANSWAGDHFIWCGVTNGTGSLALTIADANNNVLAKTAVYIQIQDIKQFYERWTVGDQPSVAPLSAAALSHENLPTGATVFQYQPLTNANTPYILHVHGYNMPAWVKDRFAETEYKRLYWQGYQGRFGAFNWPTAQNAIEFGNSESQAWLSARGLLNKLKDLNDQHSGQVYLTVHSLGNVVAGEALRLATNQVVNTYIAMQGAVSAHAYDSNTTPFTLTTDWGAPDCYAHYWTNGAPCYFNAPAGAGTYVNFYNTNDWALIQAWLLFQNSKPILSLNYSFVSPDRYFKNSGASELFFPTDTYELFANIIQSHSYPLGAQPNVGGVFLKNGISQGVNLRSLWPPDPDGYKAHVWHSAEFRSDAAQRWLFWNQALSAMKLK